jgi:protein AroM
MSGQQALDRMAQRVLGTLTIGQAPRLDILPILDRYVPQAVRRIHCGVLDGLSRAKIDADYGARPGEPILVTRLSDGSSVRLSAPQVERGAQEKLGLLEERGCDVILMLCTGTFHALHCRSSWLVEPDRIIPPLVAALLQDRRLGIIVPAAEQMQSEGAKWSGLARQPIFASANPYSDDLDTAVGAGAELGERGAQALLLDCIGFTERHRTALAQTGLPVILSNAVVAKAVAELFEA